MTERTVVTGFGAVDAALKAHWNRRHFWRCPECLTVFATETRLERVKCGLCLAFAVSMGAVVRDRLVTLGTGTPCDERCTFAAGPKCECSCGSENHGTKRILLVTRDAGGVPTATVDDPKALTVRAEWLAALEGFKAAFAASGLAAVVEKKCAGTWLSPAEFGTYLRAMRVLKTKRAAAEMKSHAGRMKKLASAMEG